MDSGSDISIINKNLILSNIKDALSSNIMINGLAGGTRSIGKIWVDLIFDSKIYPNEFEIIENAIPIQVDGILGPMEFS